MVTWHAQQAWLGGTGLESDVAIVTDGGSITEVQPGSVVDADRYLSGVVIPGLVSAHSHAFHRLLRGRTHGARGDFWSWRRSMYELARTLTPESYRELATEVFAEMVDAGVTTVGEFHYLHHRPDGAPYDDPNAVGIALIEAATVAGIRMTLLDTAYLSSDVSGAPPTPDQIRFSDGSIDAWRDRVAMLAAAVADREMVRLGVAAHSVRGVPIDDLATVAATAVELDLPFHIHVSEQRAENEACRTHHGLSPVGLLSREGALTPRTTLVHATHLEEGDIELIAAAGSMVCLCPTTEADLGDGIGPAIELASAGVPLCLGSDSNAVIDILREAHRLEHHDRLRLLRRGVHSPSALMAAATTTGMRSLGWSDRGIAAGGVADFVVVDPTSADLRGTGGSIEAIVLSATRASITEVVIGGIPHTPR
ncbi:MAG: formimidoylglutamate deiminase [Acidimicrobiia bacterium]